MVESYLTSSEQKSNLASLDSMRWVTEGIHSSQTAFWQMFSFYIQLILAHMYTTGSIWIWLAVALGVNNLFFKVANTLYIIHRNLPHIVQLHVHICVKLLLEAVWLIYIVSLHKDVEFIELSIVNFLFNWTYFKITN